MVAAQAGDRAAYEELLRDCIPFIRMVARQLGLHADAIDDVVQETLLTIHSARQTYDPNRSFVAWLRTIARRRAIDSLRGRMRVRETYAPVAYDQHPDPAPDPAEAAALTERVIVVGHAISALPAGPTRSGRTSDPAGAIAVRGCSPNGAQPRSTQGEFAPSAQDASRALGREGLKVWSTIATNG
jgi:RNA polymerase sigma factor (sigma-70 family)